MQIIGVVASAVVVAGVLMLATAVAFRSIPDIKHYRRIRNR